MIADMRMESTRSKPKRSAASVVLGVGVVVIRGGSVALGRRLSPRPCWSLPGGKIEPFESVDDCARRELHEETGLRGLGKINVMSVANLRTPSLHIITFGVRFLECSGELHVRAPDKFSAWEWFSTTRLPDDLFLPSRVVLDRFLNRTGSYSISSGLCRFSDVEFSPTV